MIKEFAAKDVRVFIAGCNSKPWYAFELFYSLVIQQTLLFFKWLTLLIQIHVILEPVCVRDLALGDLQAGCGQNTVSVSF